ncbi:MAG: DUF177 domain-containing protein [Anaeroplasma bactoclasticum]|nr:DUF177 domain-containing protein [Anaeroplasma bactoclasticum]MCM1557227.1 DUF177 domain-containing protein [Anaeroplasma bactoclasticum]
MRLTLAQLRKISMPYHTSEELDLSSELSGFEDIRSVSTAKIDYVIHERGLDTYLVAFSFEVNLVMQCAITLQDVPYKISATAEEIFTTDDQIEDAFIITEQTLDTKEAVLTNVLMNKPMTVTAEGVSFESDEEESIKDETEGINPAFAKLKDLL